MSKCFCHFNGFEVKDASARRSIEDLKKQIPSSLLEKNHSQVISFWLGTFEEYQAIEEKDSYTFYIVSDDPYGEELINTVNELSGAVASAGVDIADIKITIGNLQTDLSNLQTDLSNLQTDVSNLQTDVENISSWKEGLVNNIFTGDMQFQNGEVVNIPIDESILTTSLCKIVVKCNGILSSLVIASVFVNPENMTFKITGINGEFGDVFYETTDLYSVSLLGSYTTSEEEIEGKLEMRYHPVITQGAIRYILIEDNLCAVSMENLKISSIDRII